MSLTGIYAKKYKVIEFLPEGMASVETPQFACQKGSFTVEAAIVLPLLACFFSALMFFFQVMQIQLSVQAALEQTGRSLAILSVGECMNSEEQMTDITYLSFAKTALYVELHEVEEIERYVSGGALGISLLTSDMDGDAIELIANYKVQFPLVLLGKKVFFINQRAYFRKWTGWHAMDVNHAEEIVVYVTQNGEVYHMRKSCPYLSLSIQKIEKAKIPVLRNKDGAKYKECKSCKREESISMSVYITNYGERYHYDMNCSGLKRTIYQRKLSEVEGKEPCAKCWK